MKILRNKVFGSLLILTFLQCNLGKAFDVSNEANQKAEVLGLLAKSILDDKSIIVIAETRYDSAFLPRPRPLRQYATITGELGLRTLFPIQSIKGLNAENRIWVQMDPTDILDRRKKFYHIPALASEGVWICFLRPVKQFPKTLETNKSKLSEEIVALSTNFSPTEVADRLSFSSWLNEDTWFEPAFKFSIFQIDRELRNLSPPGTFQKHDIDQLNDQLSRLRVTSSRAEKGQFKISESEVKEIIRLSTLFAKEGEVPTVEEITEKQSEVGNEILRQLASTASDQLGSKLRDVKNSIPKSLLQNIFSESDR